MSKKILFVTDEMTLGGVSRVLNNLLQELGANTSHEIDVLVLHKHGEMLKDIPANIRVIEGSPFFKVIDQPLNQVIKSKNLRLILNKLYLLFLMKTGSIGKKIQAERKKMKLDSYDVEIAFKEGFCTIFVAYGNSRKKINWVHLDYKKQNFSANHMPLMKKVLQLIDENVAVSRVAAKSYQEVFGLKEEVKVIHNVIQEKMIKEKSKQEVPQEYVKLFKGDALTFISVGRLVEQKGYDRLINIHRRLMSEGFDHQIMIIGSGEDEAALRQAIEECGCQETFKLIGFKENPFAYFKLADCFLLPSRYEGLPTVVFESFICKTPVIATEVAGIEEQLKGDQYGLVTENNEDKFYEAMKNVLVNPSLLTAMRQNLENYHYKNSVIIDQFNQLVEGTYGK